MRRMGCVRALVPSVIAGGPPVPRPCPRTWCRRDAGYFPVQKGTLRPGPSVVNPGVARPGRAHDDHVPGAGTVPYGQCAGCIADMCEGVSFAWIPGRSLRTVVIQFSPLRLCCCVIKILSDYDK